MKKLMVHIGAGKCGSSAIQMALDRHRDALKDAGLLIPHAGFELKKAHAGTQVGFFEERKECTEEDIRIVTQRIQQYRPRMDKPASQALILSAENLSNSVHFARLFSKLDHEFDITIIMYVRPQDEFLEASWQQWVFKTGEKFDDWLASAMSRRVGNWYSILKGWRDADYRKTIVVRRFERKELIGQDIVRDFFDVIGFKSPIPPTNVNSANRSLNAFGAMLAEKNIDLFEGVHDHRFLDFLREVGAEDVVEKKYASVHLDPETRKRILDAYQDANEAMAKEFMKDGKPAFSVRADKELPKLSQSEFHEKETQLIWRILFNLYLGKAPSRKGGKGN